MIIRNLHGDNTGLLHIRENQTLVISQATYVNASLHLYNTSTTFLPSMFTISVGALTRFEGQVCGLVNLYVYGALSLELSGYTCGNTRGGVYNMSNIYATGGVINTTSTTTIIDVHSSICASAGFILHNKIAYTEGACASMLLIVEIINLLTELSDVPLCTQCSLNAACLPINNSAAECTCLPGFDGNGEDCSGIPFFISFSFPSSFLN